MADKEMDNKIFEDFTNEPRVSVVKENVRRLVFSQLEPIIQEKFSDVGWIKSNELGFVVGVGADNEGGVADVIAVIKVEAKPYYYSEGKTRKTVPFRDEFDELVDDYKYKCEQKAIKKAKAENK